MTATYHFEKRMNNRGVTQAMIELVLEYGNYCGDRIVLTKKVLKNLIRSDRENHTILMKLLDKGGLTLVYDGDALITTYNCNYGNGHRLVGIA